MPEPTPLADLLRDLPPEWLPEAVKIDYGVRASFFGWQEGTTMSPEVREVAEQAIIGSLITAMAKAGHAPELVERKGQYEVTLQLLPGCVGANHFVAPTPLLAVITAARACRKEPA